MFRDRPPRAEHPFPSKAIFVLREVMAWSVALLADETERSGTSRAKAPDPVGLAALRRVFAEQLAAVGRAPRRTATCAFGCLRAGMSSLYGVK